MASLKDLNSLLDWFESLNYEEVEWTSNEFDIETGDFFKGIPIPCDSKTLEELSNVKFLNLTGIGISNIPDELFKLEKLMFLGLANNSLKELPDSISKLTKLIQLDLSSNKLTSLPEQISLLDQLEMLDVSNNELGRIPIAIAKINCEKLIIKQDGNRKIDELNLKTSVPKITHSEHGAFVDIMEDLGIWSNQVGLRGETVTLMAYGYARRIAQKGLFFQGLCDYSWVNHAQKLFEDLSKITMIEQTTQEEHIAFQDEAFEQAIDFVKSYNPKLTKQFLQSHAWLLVNDSGWPSGRYFSVDEVINLLQIGNEKFNNR